MASQYRELKKQQARHSTRNAQAIARGRVLQQRRDLGSSDSADMATLDHHGQLAGLQPVWMGPGLQAVPSAGSSGGSVPSYADAVKGTFPQFAMGAVSQDEFFRKRPAPPIMGGIPSQHLTLEEAWQREVEDMQEQGQIFGGGGGGLLNQDSGLNQTAQENLEVNPFFRRARADPRMRQRGAPLRGRGGVRRGVSRTLPSNEGEESAGQSLGAGQGIPRRRITADEAQLCTTLHVKGLPVELNTAGILRGHFSAFGEVTNLQCFPEKKFATVEFRTNDQAVQAKRFGKSINKMAVQLFWHNPRGRGMGVFPVGGRGRGGAGGRGRGVPPPPRQPKPHTPPSSVVSSSSVGVSSEMTESSIPVLGAGPEGGRGDVFSRLGGLSQRSEDAALQEEGYYGDDGEEAGLEEGEIMFDEEEVPQEGGAGGGAQERHEAYFPGEEDRDQLARDREEDIRTEREAVREAPLEVTDYSHQMDTVARFAPHPYHLRSLHHGGAGQQWEGAGQQQEGGIEEQASFKAKDLSLQSVLLLFSLPLPSHPQGPTAKDFYDALEERDQQMRQAQVKGKTMHQGGALVGVCPDMCPEKERFLREYQRRLSRFEIFPGTEGLATPSVDHSTAVKEYSKSAADQEVSLAHEVRPPPTLQLTMDYLVVKVVNMYGQVAHGDWYDFLWDRMRSVRKDITVQHLCTTETVDLVEKCARFHILCGYLFCQESDLSVYDPAINQEHLMKCLQSLIEAYRDLRQLNEVCSNEAEFCGYDVLLHLTSGDVLNRLAKYSPTVRNTPPVRFAIKALHAVTSSNFVRFFKLVRSATFLNACILHRYFSEVHHTLTQSLIRNSALRVLSHTHSAHPMPLAVLQRMLALGQQQAAVLCSHHGLEAEGDTVVFRKGAFVDVETLPAALESQLVDTKHSGSYGEVVYGGPLPPLPGHTPYLSFSQHGTPRDVSKQHILPLPEEAGHLAIKDLLSSVVEEQVLEVCREQVEVAQDEQAAILEACQKLIEGVVSEEACIVSQQTLAESTAERDMHLKVVGEETEFACQQIMESVVTVETETVAIATINEAISQVARADATLAVHNDLVEGVVGAELTAAVREVVKACKRERHASLELLGAAVMSLMKGRVLRHWRRQLKERQRVRRAEESFPAWGSTRPLSEQVEALCGAGTGSGPHPPTFQMARWLLREELSRASREAAQSRQVAECPLDLVEVLSPLVLKQMKTCPASSSPSSDWSLALLNPAGAALEGELWKWLLQKFGQSDKEVQSCDRQVVVLQTRECDLSPELASLKESCGRGRLRLAVKAYAGPVATLTTSELKGTSGILMLLPWQHANQLSSTLLSLDTILLPHPPLPVVVMCVDQNTASRARHNTQSLTLAALSSVKVEEVALATTSAPTVDTHLQLIQEVRWLAASSLRLQPVRGQRLRQFVEAGVVELFMEPAMGDDRTRRRCGAPPQDALTVLSLYNSAVSHLASVSSHPDLGHISYPCRELAGGDSPANDGVPPLNWNLSSQLEDLKAAITRLLLPVAGLPQPSQDWSTAVQNCISYFKSWMVANSNASPLTLAAEIDAVLQKGKGEWSRPPSPHEDAPTRITLPWTKLVAVFAQHAIRELDPHCMVWLPRQQFHSSLKVFEAPIQWRVGMSHTAEWVDAAALAYKEERERRRLLRSGLKRSNSDPGNVARSKRQLEPEADSSGVHKSAADTLRHTKKLKSELEWEHRLSDKFEEELRTLLEEDVPETVPHTHLHSTHLHLKPCPPSTSHGLRTTPLPMRKSLGDQVDWVVQELAVLKQHSQGLDHQLHTLAQPL